MYQECNQHVEFARASIKEDAFVIPLAILDANRVILEASLKEYDSSQVNALFKKAEDVFKHHHWLLLYDLMQFNRGIM